MVKEQSRTRQAGVRRRGCDLQMGSVQGGGGALLKAGERKRKMCMRTVGGTPPKTWREETGCWQLRSGGGGGESLVAQEGQIE